MIKIIFSALFYFLFTANVLAQIDVGMRFPSSKEINELEDQFYSSFVDSTKLIVYNDPLNSDKGKRETSGRIFRRVDSDFPLNLHVWYLFEKNSNTASVIIYNWGLYNPSFNANKNVDLLYNLNKREDEFLEKFEILYAELINQLGEPEKIGSNLDEPHVLVKEFTWIAEDRIITLDLEFAREINNFPGIGYQANNFEILITITRKNVL